MRRAHRIAALYAGSGALSALLYIVSHLVIP